MQPQVFNFNSHSIRTVTLPNGEPGFVGKDVCEVLGYTDTVNALKQHCRGGVAKHHPILDALGRMQQTRILMADDVAALAAGSTLPGAKEAARDLLSAMGVPHVVVKNERDELVFGEEVVERLFSGYTIIRQFPVFGGKYKIDWYVPELRLAIEFDEDHHTSPQNSAADAARQAEIEAALGCRFLRYNQQG